MTAVPVATDGRQQIIDIMHRYGLDSLIPWLTNELTLGKSQDEMFADFYATPEFAARFPGIEARRKAGLPPISPEAYLSYEQTLDSQMARFGMIAGFRAGSQTFRDIATQLISGDVSIDEANARIETGYAQMRDAHPYVRQWFADKFGVNGDQALAAYFLSPSHSEAELQKMEREAQAGGTAQRYGVNLGMDEAAKIAALNIADTSQQFQILGDMAPLFEANPGEASMDENRQGVEAVFGLNQDARTAVQRAQLARQAAVGGHAIATETDTGVTGTGAAPQ